MRLPSRPAQRDAQPECIRLWPHSHCHHTVAGQRRDVCLESRQPHRYAAAATACIHMHVDQDTSEQSNWWTHWDPARLACAMGLAAEWPFWLANRDCIYASCKCKPRGAAPVLRFAVLSVGSCLCRHQLHPASCSFAKCSGSTIRASSSHTASQAMTCSIKTPDVCRQYIHHPCQQWVPE